MKPETHDWIGKAEGDWKVAMREMESDDTVFGVVSFLAQQCAEKYIKAFLEERNISFRKTHDLVFLAGTGASELSELTALSEQLAQLSTFGIAARYPGTIIDEEATQIAVDTARLVREIIRRKLDI